MSSTPVEPHPLIDGRYLLLRHIADGGMGSVHVARDERLGREVALKVMRADLVSDPEFVARFRQEAQSAARITAPNAVTVHDQGRDGDLVFLAMELVNGRTLRERLEQVGALTPREALNVMDSVLAALAAAHSLGIVHRDVKPENVLIGENGTVKVTDFGLARAVTTRTATGVGGGLLGTLAYVSPEQVSRDAVDPRSDVYSAGLMLFEMLTGEQAFSGDSPIHVAFRHVNEEVPPPSFVDEGLPEPLDEAVLAATAIDPNERPNDADRYRTLLQGVRSQLTEDELDRVAPAAENHIAPVVTTSEHTERLGSDVLANRTRVIPIAPHPAPHGSSVTPEAADVEQPTSRRRRWPLILAAVLFLLAAGTAWAFAAGPWAPRALPAVAGQDAVTAVDTLAAAGFRTTTEEAFSETIPAGRVVTTDPAPASVSPITPVTVVVSRGPERYAVPHVEGMSPEAAREAITSTRLTVAGTREAWSEQHPAGAVAGTDPAPGSMLPPGGEVTLIVSKGREPITLSDHTGELYEQVSTALQGKGLQTTVSEERHSSDVGEGRIIVQTPAEGTLHRGDTVSFVVSKGPEMIGVPQVQGMRESEAIDSLKSAGFKVKVERIVGGVFGTARTTDPEPGTQAPKGSTVTLYVV